MANKFLTTWRKAMGIKLNPREGMWINYQLRLNGKEQRDVARTARVTSSMVAHFLAGRKGSARVEAALAEVLGYRDFLVLVAAARGKTA